MNRSSLEFPESLEDNPFADVLSPHRPSFSPSASTSPEVNHQDLPSLTEQQQDQQQHHHHHHQQPEPVDEALQNDTQTLSTNVSATETTKGALDANAEETLHDTMEHMSLSPPQSTDLQASNQPTLLPTVADTASTEDYDTQSRDDNETTESQSFEIPKSGVRPFFEVSVEDPQKVGDAINAHIVYKVKTKTNSPAFRSSEFVVARRYRDFLWLYNQLVLGNPGVIVPPVPEKHALGRFQDEFVESRRIALERCLSKIVSHPMLYGDPDLKVFLESESFNIEKRQKRAEPEAPKVSFMRSFGETLTNAATNPFSKFVEVDDWFASKKNQLDALENQLKALLKSVEGLVKQRKDLGGAMADLGESMLPLASAELDKNLSTHLTILGDVQKQMKNLHEQQAQCDILTLEHTIDEYIRIIMSIRLAFNARIKAYQIWQQADSELQKKQALLEKLKSQPKPKAEKVASANQEIIDLKGRVEEYEKEFEDISKLIKSELEHFDKEKVEDFRDSVDQFLSTMVEHQKQVIAVWESYFEQTEGLQLENDDEANLYEEENV
ncbi:Vps5 C terminal like-domain-containing protein [Radiomyces spectabilis]|uniref:Vps5 C terminal like-domain-containing protein n=1 Tax=Radiomyces spectabilis TaxID=64574 RepID=UPI00221FB9A7|nr:Vps5 C terminal like-domain-containing protein [Radiomyces spectabilis]KAI8366083.1 Vps5 C terminal like-domain-containing protein [Radiomyces spectabilis]